MADGTGGPETEHLETAEPKVKVNRIPELDYTTKGEGRVTYRELILRMIETAVYPRGSRDDNNLRNQYKPSTPSDS